MNDVDYILLGDGYSANRIRQDLKFKFPKATVVGTSRSGNSDLVFDLNESSTWDNLPKAKIVFWTFPPEPLLNVQKFFKAKNDIAEKWVIIGSTSAFKVSEQDEVVTESTLFDHENERALAEGYLKNQGAILVMSSGIYGPGKNPLDWVKKGWVGKSEKFVNMIHVEDLSQFVVKAAERGDSGDVYIASDNNPQRWRDIIGEWEEAGIVEAVPDKVSSRSSKKINSSQSIKALQVNLKYRNFALEVSSMNQ